MSSSEDDRSIKLSKVSSFEGEVNWYNRKGKLFTLYDLTLALDFEGKDQDQEVSGKIKISDYEQDQEKDSTFRVSVAKGTASDAWKKWAREATKEKFLEKWSKLILELHEEQKAKIPTKGESNSKLKLPEIVQENANKAQSEV